MIFCAHLEKLKLFSYNKPGQKYQIDQKMLKNGPNWDFLENGPKHFSNIGNLNEKMILF